MYPRPRTVRMRMPEGSSFARSREMCVSTALADKIEDAVEFFLKQAPGCESGEIALFDRNERRVIGSVKWKVEPTENGLRVPHRHNLFCDWNTALVALEIQRRSETARGLLVELTA